jgi:hypothetical protein
MFMTRCTRFLFALTLMFLSVLPVQAAITGTISGTITDQTGAALPGVAVVALNQDTGIKQTVISDGKGFYSFSALNVGTYTVTATQTGFESYNETGIKVNANSSLRVDVQLKLGGATVTLNVVSDNVQVETQTTQLGEVIEASKMTSVPLNGRSYTDLLALQPGVSPYNATTEGASSGVSGDLNPGNVSINGGREASNGFMVNGGDVNDGVNNGAAIIPNLDSISEFRIITNNFDAEYGNFSGGQVNVVTKNGTNALHGSAFEFFRNTNLDAANYFASNVRGAFNQNIYGGTVGGPIKKDKVFFFADFQGTNQTIGATQSFPVFSNADLTGNLVDQASNFYDPDPTDPNPAHLVSTTGLATQLSGRLGYVVTPGEPYYQPTCNSTSWSAGSSTGCVFPGAVIPKSAWDPAAAGTLKYIPTSNSTGPDGSPYYGTSAYSQTLSDYKEAGRVDANTRYGNLFAYYFMDNDSVDNPYAGGSVPGFGGVTTSRAQMANVGLTTIRKNNAVNTFRFTYMRSANHTNNPTSPTVALSSLGFNTTTSAGGINTVNPALAGVPNINFNSFGFGNPVETQAKYDNTFQWLDNYMKVVGTHTIQFGGNYHYDQIMERNNYATNGQFNFNGQETGVDFADYLIGAVPSGGGFIQATLQLLDTRSHYIGVYAEDSWRARSNLTLNYGLRYEIITPWYDTTNKLETAIPGVQSVVFPGAPKGYLVPGDPGVPRTLAPIRYGNFAPRIGFAYAPKGGDSWFGKMTGGDKTSIRGGFGMFYTNIQDESGFIEVGDAPYGDFYSNSYPVRLSSPFVNLSDLSILPSPFPFQFPPTNVSKSNPDATFNWASVEPIAGSALLKTNDTIPYIESFYLSVQREVARNTVLTVNYVGTQGRHLMTFEEANPGDPALCLSLNASTLAAGQNSCGPGLEQNVYTLANGSTVSSTRTPFGVALGSNGYMASVATSNYNSLQTTLKHTTKNWDALLAYTYGRSFDDASGLTDVTNVINPRASYGLSAFDFTHFFVASYTVHMPFDELVVSRWQKQIIGGWAVSGITKLATGLPVNISETDDQSLLGTGGVDQPNYTPGNLVGNHNPRTRLAYFNTALFTRENLGQVGNSHRRFFHGPGINNTDLALLREFHLYREHTVQFRAEAFNVFNHTQFNNPGGNYTNQSTFGIVTSARDPRIMQLAVKYQV